jgi:hypothetical protein
MDATHPAPTSFQLRRGDGDGAKAVIGIATAPTTTLQNTFQNVRTVGTRLNTRTQASVASTQACWTRPLLYRSRRQRLTGLRCRLSLRANERRKGNQPRIIEKYGTVLADATNYQDGSLKRSTTYCYDVMAVNVAGASDATPVLCATTRTR